MHVLSLSNGHTGVSIEQDDDDDWDDWDDDVQVGRHAWDGGGLSIEAFGFGW